MFREVTRKNQALTEEECISLLKSEKRGVLSVSGDDGYPYGMPLNYYYHEKDGKLYFHTGRKGHRADALKNCRKVSFCVFDSGVREEGHWALHFRSVIVFGKTDIVSDHQEALNICRLLSRRFTEDESEIDREVAQFGAGVLVFSLTPEHMTGKKVREA